MLVRIANRKDPDQTTSVYCIQNEMGLVARKPVFGVSNKVRFKPACSATDSARKFEILLVESLDMILSNKRITKALIRLRRCTDWSAPLLFTNSQRQVFSRQGPNITNLFCLPACFYAQPVPV